MTEKQAIALYDSRFWETMTFQQRAEFQLYEDRLCMPMDVFQEALEQALGRGVWTHELAFRDTLKAELRGERPAPTMQEIVDLIPADKRVLIGV